MWGEVVVAVGSTRRDELATERNLDKTRFINLRESQYRSLARCRPVDECYTSVPLIIEYKISKQARKKIDMRDRQRRP